MAQLDEDMEAARDRLDAVREIHQQREAGQQSALNEVRTQMRNEYAGFANPNSPLSLRWVEIHDRLAAANSPILNDSVEATRYITLLAANDVGEAPVSKSVPSKPSAPAKFAPPIKPQSGAQRTVLPANQIGQIESRIDKVSNMAEYERLKKEMLA